MNMVNLPVRGKGYHTDVWVSTGGIFTLLALSFSLLSGCAYTHPVTIQQITLGPKERPIAIVAGEAKCSAIFGIGDGECSLVKAIEDAKRKAGAQNGTLYNLFIDQKFFCFPSCWFAVYHEETLSVYGTLVTYEDPLFLIPPPVPAPKARGDGGPF